MDSLLSDNVGVTGLCKGKSKLARLRFLFRSIKISSLEHWRQSFGKVKWIVLYFNDTIHIIRDKRGEESVPYIDIFLKFCLFLIDKKRVRIGDFKSGASVSRKADNGICAARYWRLGETSLPILFEKGSDASAALQCGKT